MSTSINVNLSTLEHLDVDLVQAEKHAQAAVECLDKGCVQIERISEERLETMRECMNSIKEQEAQMREILEIIPSEKKFRLEFWYREVYKLALIVEDKYMSAKNNLKPGFDQSVKKFRLKSLTKNDEVRKQFNASSYILHTIESHLKASTRVLRNG